MTKSKPARLVDLLEWIPSIGLGLALAKFLVGRLSALGDFPFLRMVMMVESILFAFVVVQGVGLCIEVVRRRSPSPWGIGRWTWSVAAVAIALRFTVRLIQHGVRVSLGDYHWPSLKSWLFDFFYARQAEFHREFACFLIAACLTMRKVRSSSEIVADSREWSGRGFAIVVVIWSMAWFILETMQDVRPAWF